MPYVFGNETAITSHLGCERLLPPRSPAALKPSLPAEVPDESQPVLTGVAAAGTNLTMKASMWGGM